MTAGWQFGAIRGPAAGKATRLRVMKVGGSLLRRSAWPEEFAALIAALPRPLILVIGGGAVVDGLRTLDAACPRPPELMHSLAIDAMRLTASLVAESLQLPLVADDPLAYPVAVLDAAAWLEAHPQWRSQLPVGWHVTSDSIAAVIATALAADLVLAKSIGPPSYGTDLAPLAAAGWVDSRFPAAAGGLESITWAVPA
jgi:aspartokinase-like uncharacterized kinase